MIGDGSDLHGNYSNFSTNNDNIGSHFKNEISKEFPIFLDQMSQLSTTECAFSKSDILKMVGHGRQVYSDIMNGQVPSKTKATDAQSVAWFLTACACQEIKGSMTRGVVRVSPLSTDESNHLKAFFSRCREANAHSRPSSHFKEITIGSQKGLDFGKGSLPFDPELSTMLCGVLHDHSFFMKFEREGLSLTSPLESLRHMKNWVKHIWADGENTVVGGKETRRETDGQNEVKEAYRNVMSALSDVRNVKKREIKDENRIFKMNNRVKTILAEINNLNTPEATKTKNAIANFNNVISHIPNADIVSGKEVLVDVKKYI